MESSELSAFIEENEGIIPIYFAFYLEAIRFNLESAARSIKFICEIIDNLESTKYDAEEVGVPHNIFLDEIQNLLTQAAAISRFFWPVRAGKHNVHTLRAANLRKSLCIGNDSPLGDRELRNNLEHFDEKLDEYLWSGSIVGHVLPAYIGAQPDNEQVPYHLFRAYYLDTCVFETLGKRYEIDPIINELALLHEKYGEAVGRT